MKLRVACPALLALLLLAPAAVQAQGVKLPTAQPTDAQVQLYEKATEAYKAEQWDRAIELLRSSLALGELNIVYLNLGRAFFRAGQCAEADKAYAKALTAPNVEGMEPEAFKARVEEYRAELESCPGTLTVSCFPKEMTVSVDGKAAVSCEQELMLAPGEHVLMASDGKVAAQARVVIQSQQRHTVELAAIADTPPPKPPPETSLLVPIGAATTLVGLGLIGGAAVVDQTALADSLDDLEAAVLAGDDVKRKSAREDADGLQTTVLLLYAAGGVVTLGGAVLLTLGLLDEGTPAEEPTATSLLPWISPTTGAAGLSWQGAW